MKTVRGGRTSVRQNNLFINELVIGGMLFPHKDVSQADMEVS